jgi:hypothetical protein
VYNFDSFIKYDIEWDNLKSQVKDYMKICETNGWEIRFSNEIINNVINPYHNILFINIQKIEPYNLSYDFFIIKN